MSPARTFQEWVAVLRWYDADTFYGALDQGVGIFRGGGIKVVGDHIELEPIRHRCALIQAPEKKTEAGPAAFAYAQQLVPPGIWPCITYKADDTFDRPLIDILLPDGRRFSEAMLAAGQAVPYRN